MAKYCLAAVSVCISAHPQASGARGLCGHSNGGNSHSSEMRRQACLPQAERDRKRLALLLMRRPCPPRYGPVKASRDHLPGLTASCIGYASTLHSHRYRKAFPERALGKRRVHPSAENIDVCEVVVPLARLERALPKKLDFESSASTNSTTGALSGGL